MRPPLQRAHLDMLFAATAMALIACGSSDGDPSSTSNSPDPASGSSSSSGSSAEPSPSASFSGQVALSGAVQHAVVCLDLNGNQACDAGEPTSEPTGADGQYTVNHNPDSLPQGGAPLIAVLPGQSASTAAIDRAFPDEPAAPEGLVLSRPVGTGGPINPLTTLLRAGVDAGMSEADARKNLALQLNIDAAKIDDYQDDPAEDRAQIQDNARIAAVFTAKAISQGAVLAVGDQRVAVTAWPAELLRLSYANAQNYWWRQTRSRAKPVGQLGSSFVDESYWMRDGAPVTDTLYSQAYLGANGYTVCNDQVPTTATLGNPSRTTYCGAETSLVFRTPEQDLKDRFMTEVVDEMAGADGNTINAGMGSSEALATALGSAQFPEGSALSRRHARALNAPPYISSLRTDAFPQSTATTLEQLINAYPSSEVNVANGRGSLSLGLLDRSDRILRVAFTSAAAESGTVRYYGCDWNESTDVVSNCERVIGGTFRIETVNGTRLLRFEGAPETIAEHTMGFAEVIMPSSGPWIYRYRQAKPSAALSQSNRLNGTAWTSMKAHLGL